MRFLPERTTTSVLLLAILIAILATLAVLQYRWSGQVSEAEHERLQRSLMASMGQFRLEFNLKLLELALPFEAGPSVVLNRDWSSYAETCSTLLDRSENSIVSNVYLWVLDSAGRRVLRLNRVVREFEPVPWPAVLQSVKKSYESAGGAWRPPGQRAVPGITGSDVPLLVRPMPASRPGLEPPNGRLAGLVIIELSPESMRRTLLPELAHRYFSGSSGFAYRVGVIAHDRQRLIYGSEPGLRLEFFDRPDAGIGLWMGDRVADRMGGRMVAGQLAGPIFRFLRALPPAGQGEPRVPAVAPPDGGPGWQLVARHPSGSLEAAVVALRVRNLATSFGVLVLLAVSIGLIIASARRAQRLARLQMDFVAGVSHELRTPLAVISSAGDNLADGIVEVSREQVRKYGELIRSEAGRLTRVVEHVLEFGKLRRGQETYDLSPANLNEVACEALSAMQAALKNAGFSIETQFASDLPAVTVDAPVLSNCIQNLVENAIKYSGGSRWLSVRTANSPMREDPTVELVVEDKGMGIESEDLPHIFDAFYRGRTVKAAQIHGAGLGLFMVREAVISMGGSLRAESKPGSGTTLTMTFPAAAGSVDSASEAL